MEKLSVKDVVFVNFPFSDLKNTKLRPAVIIANVQNDDYILCQITSKAYSDPQSISLLVSDFETGTLKIDSYIRPSKIFTAHRSIINNKVAELKTEMHVKLIKSIIKLIS